MTWSFVSQPPKLPAANTGAKFFGDTPASLQWNEVLGPSRGPQAAALLRPTRPLPTCPAGARTRTETADFLCDLLSQVSFLGFPQTRKISLAEKKKMRDKESKWPALFKAGDLDGGASLELRSLAHTSWFRYCDHESSHKNSVG